MFMSVFKTYREIPKYFKLTAQTYFHRINDVGKRQGFSSFPSGNGEELSPLIRFPISSLRKKISLEIMHLSKIRFQLDSFKTSDLSNRWASCEIRTHFFSSDAMNTPCFIPFVISFFNPNLKSAISDPFLPKEGKPEQKPLQESPQALVHGLATISSAFQRCCIECGRTKGVTDSVEPTCAITGVSCKENKKYKKNSFILYIYFKKEILFSWESLFCNFLPSSVQ